MKVSTAEAKNRLTELIRAAEAGERVVITRHGRPVAHIISVPPESRPHVRLGTMRGRIKFNPGWDAPVTEEELLGEEA